MKLRSPIAKREYRFDVDARVRFRVTDVENEERAADLFEDALLSAGKLLNLQIDVESYRPD